MKIYNPFTYLTKFERILWIVSLIVVTISFMLGETQNTLTLMASLIGVTALIFVSRGDVFGQILTVLFSLTYGIISWQFKYYGEMITYLGMTMPIALMSVYTWIKNPYKDTKEVTVNKLTIKQSVILLIGAVSVTAVLYFILKALKTTNLLFSTISVTTSFAASSLTMLRSQFYALAYAANDIVLIILWVLATLEQPAYLPMIICFVMFFINDIYGFISWEKMRRRQKERTE